jgi:hypothetical protein
LFRNSASDWAAAKSRQHWKVETRCEVFGMVSAASVAQSRPTSKVWIRPAADIRDEGQSAMIRE